MQEKFYDLPLEDVLGDRFGRYSKYIIQERALPDARDGLKPVQRRILYSMYVEGNTNDKAFRKSAKTVGNVIGNYHPHGDSSVYEAMVRMSQDWKVRNMLVQMHGNNGSIDGDSPAAMRYTEARLSGIASQLLKDLDQETVDFIPNFDDSAEEPTVLPAMYPNLLVNGSTGISAGYATEIPPHHLGEVIDGVIMRIDNPLCTVDELMTVVKGPDFPTGAIIQGVDGIKKAYETGKGKIIIRAKAEVEPLKGGKQQIVVTEIPYEVNKANLVKKIDEVRFDKKIDGIIEVRDETDRTGLRIVIELKKDADAQLIQNFLFKTTDLQVAYNFNMVAIANKRPMLMSLPRLLDFYIEHQKEVITRRSKYQLRKAKQRQHIVEGLMKALSILDQVIATIRASKDKKDAKDQLIAKYGFTEAQSEAIVTLQLYRLTNTDITQLQNEAAELAATIENLTLILENNMRLLKVIKTDLLNVKKTYADARRSLIEDEIENIQINKEDMIPQEDVVVIVTKDGYVKRTSVRSYSASNGKDLGLKEGDYVLNQFYANTTHTLLMFTNKGNYLFIPVYELPDIRWKDLGQHVANIVPIERDEEFVTSIVVSNFEEANQYLLFATKNGLIKKSELSLYKAQRYSKPLLAINLKDDDEVISVLQTDGNKQIFLTTKNAYALWFGEDEVTPIGVRAAGVKGINLKDDDKLVSMNVFNADENAEFLVATQRGSVKKVTIDAFEKASRAKRGVVLLRELKTNPHRVTGVFLVEEGKEYFLESSKGMIESVDPKGFKVVDRYHNGSFVVDVDEIGDIKAILVLKSLEYQIQAGNGQGESNS